MTSKEALERIKKSHYIAMACMGIDKPDIETEKAIKTIEKDLKILECFRKIPRQDLKEFIECQIRYEKNINTWLEACNCDLGKEEPTKHLVKIKEWLGNDKRV